jgi:hypothetical protein
MWALPAEWSLPDYAAVRWTMRRRAEGWCDYGYDDAQLVGIAVEVGEMKVKWVMPGLELAELGMCTFLPAFLPRTRLNPLAFVLASCYVRIIPN